VFGGIREDMREMQSCGFLGNRSGDGRVEVKSKKAKVKDG